MERNICGHGKELSHSITVSGDNYKWKCGLSRSKESALNMPTVCCAHVLESTRIIRLQRLTSILLAEGCASKMESYILKLNVFY